MLVQDKHLTKSYLCLSQAERVSDKKAFGGAGTPLKAAGFLHFWTAW